MASVQEQLASEEKKLRRMLKEPTPDSSKISAATEKLRSTAENVKRLRALVQRPSPEEHLTALAARRKLEAEQRAKDEERKKREPGRKAAKKLLAFAHPELVGANLDTSRLSIEEGEDLLALVEARYEGALPAGKERRYEKLVGTLAADPDLFERRRKEREAAEAEAKAAERARLTAMPLRRYEGKGGVYLPSYLFSWLTTPREEGLNVTDLGVLAATLFAFEHGVPPFYKSEIVDGAIVLDGSAKTQLLPHLNPDGELGSARVLEAVGYFVANRWLELDTTEEGRTRIRLGERARRQLEDAAAVALVT